jgi:hypothetical protein
MVNREPTTEDTSDAPGIEEIPQTTARLTFHETQATSALSASTVNSHRTP